MSNDIIATDLHSQNVDNIVTLFILELKNGSKLYFHPGVDSALASVTFRDDTSPYTVRTYTPLPIDLSGVEVKGDGASNRPTLTIANVLPVFRDLLPDFEYNKVVGSRLVRRTTLEKYLSSGSSSSAPVEFPKVSYIVDRVKTETSQFITFDLASPFDVEGITLPRRTVVGKFCSWKYKQFPDGGCHFANKGQFGDTSSRTHHVFFTIKNELITHSSNTVGAQAYNAGLTYSSNRIVEQASSLYQSLHSDNLANTPGLERGSWRKLHKYNNWTTSKSYSVDDFVLHEEVLYRCVNAHTSVANKYPADLPSLWEHGDLCGKTLTSCNIRYNAQLLNPGVSDDGLISVKTRNGSALPFGGFPGSAKHR